MEVNLHPKEVEVKVHFPAQTVVHDLATLVLLVAKSWLLKMRNSNQQTQWVLPARVVEFSASSVVVVVMLQESVQTLEPSL